jgi:aspartyl-tRNA(Asn)/glutamyl-tRNA(Gln) amidotransferase subunit A
VTPDQIAGQDICRMDAVTLAREIREKRVSPTEVVDAVLDRMDRLEPTLHAFCTPAPDQAHASPDLSWVGHVGLAAGLDRRGR